MFWKTSKNVKKFLLKSNKTSENDCSLERSMDGLFKFCEAKMYLNLVKKDEI